jgi:hypothetical protein
MNQALYAHMNNKRKMEKKIKLVCRCMQVRHSGHSGALMLLKENFKREP